MNTEMQYADNVLYSKIGMLYSAPLKQELASYVEYLLSKQIEKKENIRARKLGCGKGMFVMSADFDQPLQDFKEYMP